MEEKLWLTPQELADIYQIRYPEALVLAKSGEVAVKKSGSRYRFRADDAARAFKEGVFERVLSY